MNTLKEVLMEAQKLLASVTDQSRLEAELLLCHSLKISREELLRRALETPKPSVLKEFQQLLQRRLQGEPIAYIIECKEFYGRNFKVSPSVLIPRPDSEVLIEASLEVLRPEATPQILDLGGGSGCLGQTLLCEHNGATLTTVDISPEATFIAQENAKNLSLLQRIRFLTCSIEQLNSLSFPTPFDLVIANPPYIANADPDIHQEVHKSEPHIALYSGDSGLEAFHTWIPLALEVTRPKGHVIFEIGWQQASSVEKIFLNTNLVSWVKIIKDLAGHQRALLAQKKS